MGVEESRVQLGGIEYARGRKRKVGCEGGKELWMGDEE